jgi:hypothetical protein
VVAAAVRVAGLAEAEERAEWPRAEEEEEEEVEEAAAGVA